MVMGMGVFTQPAETSRKEREVKVTIQKRHDGVSRVVVEPSKHSTARPVVLEAVAREHLRETVKIAVEARGSGKRPAAAGE